MPVQIHSFFWAGIGNAFLTQSFSLPSVQEYGDKIKVLGFQDNEMQSRMGILGKYCSYDLRSTFATRAIELGQASHQIATLMGHSDSRMVETVYARRRDKTVLDQRAAIEQLCG